jgi:hypothetical protein
MKRRLLHIPTSLFATLLELATQNTVMGHGKPFLANPAGCRHH